MRKKKQEKQPSMEFVFIGKTFLSQKRADEKKQRLLNLGYTLTESNSKKLTFKK